MGQSIDTRSLGGLSMPIDTATFFTGMAGGVLPAVVALIAPFINSRLARAQAAQAHDNAIAQLLARERIPYVLTMARAINDLAIAARDALHRSTGEDDGDEPVSDYEEAISRFTVAWKELYIFIPKKSAERLIELIPDIRTGGMLVTWSTGQKEQRPGQWIEERSDFSRAIQRLQDDGRHILAEFCNPQSERLRSPFRWIRCCRTSENLEQ